MFFVLFFVLNIVSRTYGRTDRWRDRWTDGHTILKRCENASNENLATDSFPLSFSAVFAEAAADADDVVVGVAIVAAR